MNHKSFFRRIFVVLCGASVLTASSLCSLGKTTSLPHLKVGEHATHLIVDGEPYLLLAGELHNSTSSSREYLQPHWEKLKEAHLNTVLAVVSWDLVEPQEGVYDFSMVDALIEDANAHDLKLVLLWFGSWKNGLSHYIPDWVKRDRERFPYARTRHGSPEILSVFSENNWEADARAYGAFMKHVGTVDKEGSVLMIQVQNEVGLHGDSRDRSELAEAAYASQVPEAFIAYLQKNRDLLVPSLRSLWSAQGFKTEGSWAEVFGDSEATEEVFMVWHYASYIDKVAAEGKAVHAIPTFVNAWIVQPQDEHPGEYPSGGPQGHNLDIWNAAAPNIDLLCPDIYLPNFGEVCEEYVRPWNPLFIPESRSGLQGNAQAFLAIGRYDAIGYSPFGIEGRLDDFGVYETLDSISHLILKYQGTDKLYAVSLAQDNPSEVFEMGGFRMKAGLVSHYRPTELPERAYGIILQLDEEEFLIVGGNLQVSFASASPDESVGLATVEEGVFKDEIWIPGRTLNGDEIMLSYAFDDLIRQKNTGTGIKIRGANPQIQKATLYRFMDSK